jgi:hypothetical protein
MFTKLTFADSRPSRLILPEPGNACSRVVAVLCVGLMFAGSLPLLAFQDQQAQQAPPPGANAPLLNPQQLDSVVSPIALFADPLVAQILAASTYPLEIVEANRWLQANGSLQGTALTDAARQQNWDPSVQALVVFPSVLEMLDKNLRWTTDLGNAFLEQEQDVMDAIQRQRQAAQASGKLASSPQQEVQQTTDNGQNVIVIQPTNPQVIYVPVYNPVTIWGPYYYNPWGPFWYPPPPPGAIYGAAFFSFWIGFGVGSYFNHWGGWNSWGWGCGWGHRSVTINNNFYIRNNYRSPTPYYRNGSSNWVHNPAHRVGVPYPSRDVANRYPGAGNRPSTLPSNRPGGGNYQPGNRPGNVPSTRPASGTLPSNRPSTMPATRPTGPDMSRDKTAWGTANSSGSRARIESDRGYSSLGNRAPSAPQSRPAPQSKPAPQSRPAPSGGSRKK